MGFAEVEGWAPPNACKLEVVGGGVCVHQMNKSLSHACIKKYTTSIKDLYTRKQEK